MPGRHRALEIGAVVALLALLAVQAVASMRLKSCTCDEVTHLPAGYTYVTTGDLRLNSQHPPLIKQLAGLALLPLRPQLDLEHPGWSSEPPDEWSFGRDFLYANDADRLLFWGRLPTVVLALILGLYVFLWARRLWGVPAGLTALLLYVTCPSIVAHARWVTMDLGLACFATGFVFHLWRTLDRGPWAHAVGAGLSLGLALSAKFTAVLLVPAAALLVLAAWLVRARAVDGPSRRPGRDAALLAAMAGLAVLVTWTSYGFPADPLFYVRGLRQINADHDPQYWYYLLGEFRQGGWWWYFAAALALKTRAVVLALLGLALVLLALRRLPRVPVVDELCLLLPPLLLFVVTSAMAANLGVRYVLPVYPFLFISLGRLATLVGRDRRRRLLAAALAVWAAVSAAAIYPDYLSYFNELAGGAAHGHRYLDDSNIDWGQDLKRLPRALEERDIGRVRLLYNWPISGDPAYYGVPVEPVTLEVLTANPPPRGVYAVSTSTLIGGELAAQQHGLPSDWLSRYEPIGRVGYSIYLFRFE